MAAIRLSLGTVLHGWYGSRHYRTRQLTVHSNRQRALQEMVHVISQCESDIIVVGAGYTGKRKHRKGTRVIPGLKYLVRYLSLHRRLVLFNEYLTRWAAAGNSKRVVLVNVRLLCMSVLTAKLCCTLLSAASGVRCAKSRRTARTTTTCSSRVVWHTAPAAATPLIGTSRRRSASTTRLWSTSRPVSDQRTCGPRTVPRGSGRSAR